VGRIKPSPFPFELYPEDDLAVGVSVEDGLLVGLRVGLPLKVGKIVQG